MYVMYMSVFEGERVTLREFPQLKCILPHLVLIKSSNSFKG